MALLTRTLTDYINTTRRLLHDANATYWDDTAVTEAINRAMLQRDRDSGMNRAIANLNLVVGQQGYTIAGLGINAFDVLSIVVIYTNNRYLLREEAYTTLATEYQPFQSSQYQQPPMGFAKYGAGTIWIAPSPNQTYATEWDCLVYSAPLVNPTDLDPLPYPWGESVPHLACYFLKLQLQQYQEADAYKQGYMTELNDAIATANNRRMPLPYGGQSGVWR